MPLPSQAQLDERQKHAQERLSKLRTAYEGFLKSWQDIEHDTDVVRKTLSGHIGTAKIYDILKQIDTINDSL